ncbi:MAG: MFS transporter [Pseudoxanthomonas suwonensis]|nr:MFS transporter [Pseudoxanthomonas suwonensis]
MTSTLTRFTNIRRDELVPALLAGLFFFCILTALMLLRPARDALGMQRGLDAVRWLFMGTAVVTLLANPVFGWLVSRFRRVPFIAATYGFFAVSLLAFWWLLTAAPQAVGETSGMVFYVWFSVFNLFVTMLFWALMADRFSLAQSRRLFPPIAAGGSLGAIFGPWLAGRLVEPLGTPVLLPVAVGFLLLAIGLAAAVAHSRRTPITGERVPDPLDALVIGGSAWAGIRALFASRYLAGIAGFVLLMTVMATFLYFTRLQMVAALGDDVDMRTGMFARLDFWTQSATLLLQLLLAGQLMKRIGVGATLVLLPLAMAAGFIGLALFGSLAVLVLVDAGTRAIQRGLTRPARETLYTVLGREDKYKAKAVTDTFVYRAGDVLGAQVEGVLGKLGMGLAGLAAVAVPLAVLWAGLGLWLGRTQARMAVTTVDGSGTAEPAE